MLFAQVFQEPADYFLSFDWNRLGQEFIICSCHLIKLHKSSFVIISRKLFELSCRVCFWPHLSMVKNHFKNNKFSYPYPEMDLHWNRINSSFSHNQPAHQIYLNLSSTFEISCSQTNRQTEKQGWKHNLHPPLVAEVIKNSRIRVRIRIFTKI